MWEDSSNERLLYLAQDTVNYPVHIKNFNKTQLRQLCKELRCDIINTVSKTGGTFPTFDITATRPQT